MPVESQTVEYTYTGDGFSVVFPFPSLFLSSADIVVGLGGVLQTSGYTVTGAGADTGGEVTFAVAPAVGVTVLLLRKPSINQLIDFVSGQTVLEKVLDRGLDKLTMIAQYLKRTADRCLKFPDLMAGVDGTLPAPQENRALMWGPSNNIINAPAAFEHLVDVSQAVIDAQAAAATAAANSSKRRIVATYADAAALTAPQIGSATEIETMEYRAGTGRGGAIYAVTLGSIFELTTADGQKWKMKSILTVDRFGAYGDGTTDDLPYWNAARDANVARGGGVVLVGDREYAMTDSFVISTSYTLFRGVAKFVDLFTFPTAGTRVKRIGSGTAAAFILDPPAGATQILHGGGFEGIAVNCQFKASIGFYFGSVTSYVCRECMSYLATNAAYFTTATYADGVASSNYNEHGDFRRSIAIVTASAIGFMLSGKTDGMGHSTAFCDLTDTYVTHENGTAYLFDAADDCYGMNIAGSRISHKFTGTRTSGSAVITGIAPGHGVITGNVFTGQTGITDGTTVLSVTSTTVTLSANATASGTTSLTADGAGALAYFNGSGASKRGLAAGNSLWGHGRGKVVFADRLDGTGFCATGNRFHATSVDDAPTPVFAGNARKTNEFYDSGCEYTGSPAFGYGPPLRDQQFGLSNADIATFKGAVKFAFMTKATLLALSAPTYGYGATFMIADPVGGKGFYVYSNGVNWLYLRDDSVVV